ncbi:TPA: hypothetical protein RUV26_002472 [Staphylococcus aureus]|nr:hypothetical protein [Staphylococcus aureus]
MNSKNNKKAGVFTRIWDFFKAINHKIKTNPALSKTIVWTISLMILSISLIGGLHHKHKTELERAYRLSNIDQEISFSLTGTKVKLSEQKRYKDMTIIPIKFDSSDKQSLNANDYSIGIEPKKGDNLSSKISASIVSFSTNGSMVIALKGDLPKQPIQILLRNNNNFSENDDGNGTYMNWGKEQKTKLNVVAFTVNPRGENIKVDDRINSNMTMQNLYKSAFGDKKIATLTKEKEATNKKIQILKTKNDETHRQIVQLNKALDRKENDFELSSIKSSEENKTGYSSKLRDSDYDDLKKSDLSASDLEAERNKKINTYESTNDDIKDEDRNIKAIENKINEEKIYSEKIESLTTICQKFKILH